MLPLTKKMQLVGLGVVCSILIGIGVNILFERLPEAWNVIGHIDLFFYKNFLTPTQTLAPQVVIIDRNDAGERSARKDFAQMIRKLHHAGAACIALDVLFLGEGEAQDDAELIESVSETRQVILAVDFNSRDDARPSQVTLALLEDLARQDASLSQSLMPRIQANKGVALPFDKLLRVARAIGHVNPVEGETYHFPLAMSHERNCYISLPVAMAKCYLGTQRDTLPHPAASAAPANGKNLDYAGKSFNPDAIPLDKDGQLLVQFIPLEEFDPFPYSWNDADSLLQMQRSEFQNAIVLIINSAADSEYNTPIGRYPGWAILASVSSQLLQQSYIDTSTVFYPVVFSAFIVGAGLLLFLFIAPRLSEKWRKTRWVFGGGAAFLLIFAFAFLHYGQTWIGVTVPLIVYNASMVVVRQRYYRLFKPPEYLRFAVAVLERQGERYPLKVFDAHGGTEEGNLFLSATDLKEPAFLEAVDHLKKWEGHEKSIRKDMRTAGDTLFQVMFQTEAVQLLKNSLTQARNEDKNLRVVLQIDSPELNCLPWELLHNSKLPPGFIALHERLSIVRDLPLAQPVRPMDVRIPLKILAVIASPVDLPALDIAGEKRILKKSLFLIRAGGDVRLRICEHVTQEKLSVELKRKPDILHFIGHGHFDSTNKESWLAFETETGEASPVEAEALGSLLQESTVKLVVLNSCKGAVAAGADAFTGMAQNLVRFGVPAVVAMQYPIRDIAAVLFTKSFYAKLITNYSIDAAIAETRRDLKNTFGLGQQDWATPVLFMRAHQGRIFTSPD